MPVWFLIQNGVDKDDLSWNVEDLFFKARGDMPKGTPIALLVESPGGQAASAYGIAKVLRRRCGSFVAIVPSWAKSAATLLCLGASEIIMAEHAQLGPLDVQIFDRDREERSSALNETQSLERLHAAALAAFDQTMFLLGPRTKKRIEFLLPHALKFTAEMMRPLLEKVDVVQYTARLRDLKVAEEYAIRLLQPAMDQETAETVAGHLVEAYPEHGFPIDYDEALDVGLNVKEPTAEQGEHLDKILLHLPPMANALGRVVET
jgi:hypothetical protein